MMNDYLSNPEEAKEYEPRYKALYFLIAAIVSLFTLRLWHLQVIQGSELREFSEQNRLKHEKVLAPRGIIFDRNGQILVDNLPGFDVTITPQYVTDIKAVATDLAEMLQLDSKKIIQEVKRSRIQNGSFRPVRVAENISRDNVIRVEKLRVKHPGLEVQTSIKRSYLLGPVGAQLLGYVGEISKDELPRYNEARKNEERFEQGDIIGKSGLEQVLDRDVRGIDGMRFVQVDAHGREISQETPSLISSFTRTTESIAGQSLVLTIDKDIQEAAWKALAGTDRIGAAIAMDPKSGEILAWIVSPSYDPSEFSTGISSRLWGKLLNDPFKPLRNKIVQDALAPGSTFKAIVAIAALQEKVISPETTHFCSGSLRLGRKLYHCHLKQGHGTVNITQAIERSCNIFFYKMGMALGIDRIAKYARAFGLGTRTGIVVPNEVPGLIPDSEWKKRTKGEEWQAGENLSNAIGQGFILATPLQMATAYASIASGGPVFRPHVLKRIIDIDGKILKEIEPELKQDISQGINTDLKISPEVFATVREGLRLVSNGAHGTAGRSRIPGVEIAGKTGTSQLFQLSQDQVYAKCQNRPIQQRHHGWFMGYAPATDPKIVVAILSEHSCSGSGGAAPVGRDIIQAYLQKYHPELIKTTVKVVPAAIAAPAEIED